VTTCPQNASVDLTSASNQHSLRLVIQHNWSGTGKSRRSRYRLILYGDRHAYRDFDSLGDLSEVLQTAGLHIDGKAISPPDPQASSLILSQAIELNDAELSSLGLNQSP
jgi:hypothetical protein